MTNWKNEPIGFLDTETTGCGDEARILEMCLVVQHQGKLAYRVQATVNPGKLDWDKPEVIEALRINGLSRELIEQSKSFAEVFPSFSRFMHGCKWLCGQFVEFDLRMLEQEICHTFMPCDSVTHGAQVIDTIVLDFGLNPNQPSYKLAEIARRWGINIVQQHRASADVDLCVAILDAMLRRLPSDTNEFLALYAQWEESRKRWREERERRKAEEKKS